MFKSMNCSFQDKMKDPAQGVYLFGTTPPKEGTCEEKAVNIANKLLGRLSDFDYDGLIVYDIQDESSRTAQPRPFPFKHTLDPVSYSRLLKQLSGNEVITYKSVAQRCADTFCQWLNQTEKTHQINNIVLVGSPSSRGEIKLGLSDAYDNVRQQDTGVFLGGVTIAERHAKKLDEHQRLLNKAKQGCQYFISQAVYDAEATIDLLTSYSVICRQNQVTPKRIILTFSPCGSDKTLEFMQWLGINVPPSTRARILASDDMLKESVAVCAENLQHILSSCAHLDIPLGLNIESLTNRKVEIDASVDLFKQLQGLLQSHLSRRQRDADMAVA